MTTLTPAERKLIEQHRARISSSTAPTGGCSVCVVIRESSKKALLEDNDLPEFAKMSQQVLDAAAVRDLPGAGTIRALAVDLVKDNARSREIREHLGAEAIYDGRIVVGYQIRVEHVLYVLAVFSAAKTKVRIHDDLASIENAFSDAIARLVRIHDIKNLHTGPFHRLVRHKKASESLETALQMAKTVVHFSGGTLDLSSESGRTMWTIQVLMAEAQYNGTVSGLTNGSLARLEEGQWPKSGSQLPAAGYRLRSDTDPSVVPDLEQLPMIRDLIGWAADERLSDSDIAQLLADNYSYGSNVQRSRSGGQGTITDTRYPATAVRNLLRKGLPLWRDGHYTYTTDVPQHMETDKLRPKMAALVETSGEQRTITVQIPFHHEELPDGQWADRNQIEAAISLRLARTEKKTTGRSAAETDRKPLSGIGEWIEGDRQWRLSARHRTFYRLVHRPVGKTVDASGNPLGWAEDDYTHVAAIGPEDLHPALARAIAKGLEDGAAWSRTTAPATADPAAARALTEELAARIELIDRQVKDAETDLELAREEGYREIMKDRMRSIEKLRRDRASTVEQMARAEGAIADLRALDTGTAADGKQLAALLAKLASTVNTADPDLNMRLRETLVDLRASLAEDDLTVTVSCKVKVPTSDGQLIVGPFSCTVTNRRRKLAAKRAESMLQHFLADGLSIEQAAQLTGYTDMAFARRKLMQEIEDSGAVPSKGLRVALLAAPAATRAVVWAEITSRRTGRPFRRPADVPATFAQHVREVYTSSMQWSNTWKTDTSSLQQAVDLVADTGSHGMLWDTFMDVAPAEALSRHAQEDLVRGRGQADSDQRISYNALLERSELWHRHNAERRVWARQCPHCRKRTLTHILRAPEIPGGLVCTSCRRTEDGPYGLKVPDLYLEI